MWDADLLLGVQGQGVACTVYSTVVVFLNALIQAVFTYIIATQMTAPSIKETTVSDFRRAWPSHAFHLASRFPARGVSMSRAWRIDIAQHLVRQISHLTAVISTDSDICRTMLTRSRKCRLQLESARMMQDLRTAHRQKAFRHTAVALCP